MSDGSAARQAFVKRRNYFVKRRLQARYVAYYLVILLASSAALLFFLEQRARLVLRTEMIKAHSSVFDTWSILRPEMARTTLAVVAVLIAAAALVTLAVTCVVHRASKTVAANLGAYCAGKGRVSWAGIRHPREMAELQTLLARGIETHEVRLSALHEKVGGFLSRIRALRVAEADDPGCRGRVLSLRGEFQAAVRAFEHFEKEG